MAYASKLEQRKAQQRSASRRYRQRKLLRKLPETPYTFDLLTITGRTQSLMLALDLASMDRTVSAGELARIIVSCVSQASRDGADTELLSRIDALEREVRAGHG